jgi:tripartite-type tricarboxylate transporter receptor subunit TctC
MYGSLTGVETALIVHTFGVHYRYIQGYSTSAAEATGFLRGDCQLFVASPASLLPQIQNHTVSMLMVLVGGTSLKVYDPPGLTFLAPVPTLPQVLAKAHFATGAERQAGNLLRLVATFPNNVIGYPAKTPKAESEAMMDAMKAAMKVGSIETVFDALGDQGAYASPSTTLEQFKAAMTKVVAVQNIVGTL